MMLPAKKRNPNGGRRRRGRSFFFLYFCCCCFERRVYKTLLVEDLSIYLQRSFTNLSTSLLLSSYSPVLPPNKQHTTPIFFPTRLLSLYSRSQNEQNEEKTLKLCVGYVFYKTTTTTIFWLFVRFTQTHRDNTIQWRMMIISVRRDVTRELLLL